MPERPSRVRVQLGAELRILRELVGLTQAQLGDRIGVSQVAVSRIELGHQLSSRTLVDNWARALDAADDAADRVRALVEAAHGETRPWPELDEGGHLQATAARREEDARRIRDCSLSWLPGLCQTAEYARQLIPQVDPERSIDHAAAVAARMERQQILYREGRSFEFLVSEHALRWAPGPGVMPGQRAMLATIATLSDVQVRVLPSARVGEPEWHNFVLYDPADGTGPTVATELLHGGQALSEVKVVGLYEALWSRLWDAAAVGDDAVNLIGGGGR